MDSIYFTQFYFIPSEVKVQIGDLMIPSVIKWNQEISEQAVRWLCIQDQRLVSGPLLPPAILDHSYSLAHIDQVCAERCKMEWCEALCGMLRHLRRRSSLITSSIPSVTLYHVAIAYWISLIEMLLCPTLLPLTLKPNQENDQIIIPCW